ncbi:hypothetical protein PQO01_18405 [Lentisphaera marina]|uniref:hypothetical protein n=1 Tax=Lentisphaera marina TaxID=1111041 RepID=UPI0023650E5E|nr:hypothetical protein [Lentisphaera marina]MDD7986925.1 hypothetical protein [Lentisphaera marina]
MTDFIHLLKKYEVEFLVCGGHAVAFYGYPRMTLDFDLLIKPDPMNAKKIMQCLRDFGFGSVKELSEEKFCQRGTVFTLGVQPNQIDLLTSVSSQDENEIFSNQVKGALADITLNFISFDDLIRAKKEANRLKDQLDVQELESLR